MLPTLFCERFHRIFPNVTDLMHFFSYHRYPSVRVNTLVVGVDEGVRVLCDLGFDPLVVFSGVNAFLLRGRSKRALTESEYYKQGWYYLQSLSSMVPVWAIEDEVVSRLSLHGDLQVLDMCAAPGSKTSHLAAVMNGRGDIVAYDVNRKRMYMLRANLQLFGVRHVTVCLGNAGNIWRRYGPVFDVVLLDAPCSGEGRFFLSDVASYSDWSMGKIFRLSRQQRRLIYNGVMCLKSGGVLVYSTCTFAPEENEFIIQYALDTFGDAITVETLHFPFLRPEVFVDGLSFWDSVVFDPRLSRAVRIRPDFFWDGFFVCVIRRL